MILRKRVILTVNGKDEILEMEELADQAGRLSDGQVQPVPEAADISVSEEPVSISSQQMNETLQDANTLRRQVRIRPYFENGRPGGLMLSGVRSEAEKGRRQRRGQNRHPADSAGICQYR